MTTLLLTILIVAVGAVGGVLFRGFSILCRRLDDAVKMSVKPMLCVTADIDDNIALVNVGLGTAFDVEWKESVSGEFRTISRLSPQQSLHIRISEQERGTLTLNYKSISGERLSRSFDIAQVMASEDHFASA